MSLRKKWEAAMGPVDERLESESNRAYKVGYIVLVIGSLLCCYYGLMLNQVADVTDTPILTAQGEHVFSPSSLLLIVVFIGALIPLIMQMRAGITDIHSRYAEVDMIPWGFVALTSLAIGAGLGFLSTGLRILAEIQIVGIDRVMWFGDIAIGVVYFTLAFIVGMIAFGAFFHAAIKRRITLERELEE